MTSAGERSPQSKVAAVSVTYNRIVLLREAVAALRMQTCPLDAIIIVDNGSTDDTAAWLAEQADLIVIRQENLGGAGGFQRGIREACERGFDWVWCMDDDSIAQPDSLEKLIASDAFGREDVGFLSPLVLWTDGTPHLMNLPAPARLEGWVHHLMETGLMGVPRTTFVGALIPRRVIEDVGLPFREFVIWGDDTEYSLRITQRYKGFVVLPARMIHKTATNVGSMAFPVPKASHWKYCYTVRNDFYIHTRYGPFAKRILMTLGWIAFVLFRALSLQAPVKSLWWLVKGLWFRPKLEFVRSGVRSNEVLSVKLLQHVVATEISAGKMHG